MLSIAFEKELARKYYEQREFCACSLYIPILSLSMTKLTKLPVRQAIRIFAVRRTKPWILGYTLTPSEDSDQTGRMQDADESSMGAHVILLVLSCCGYFNNK